jgi:hypothetical protein
MNRMRLSVVLIALASSVLTSRADLVIYTTTQTSRIVGEGQDRKITSAGYVVYDFDNGGGAYNISHFKVNGITYFSAEPVWNLRVYHFSGAGGRTYTAFMYRGMTNAPAYFGDYVGSVIAQDSVLPVSISRSVLLPKRFTGSAGGATFPTSRDGLFEIDSFSLQFSAKESQTSNNAGETPYQAVSRFRARLLSLGYIEQ